MSNLLASIEYATKGKTKRVSDERSIQSKLIAMLSLVFLCILMLTPNISLAQFGYKNLKPGMTVEELKPLCGYEYTQWIWTDCENYSKAPYPMVFLYTSSVESMEVHTIAVLVGTYDAVFDNLLKSMTKKYKLDYQFSDLDLNLYNNGKKERITISFEEGQVLLFVTRISGEHSVFVTYSTKKQGKTNLDINRPSSLNTNDF